MFKRLLSPRFLPTFGVCVAEALGLPVPVEIIGAVAAYVLGESATDAANAFLHSPLKR